MSCSVSKHRDAYLAVDRRHFVEPSTLKAFTYAVSEP